MSYSTAEIEQGFLQLFTRCWGEQGDWTALPEFAAMVEKIADWPDVHPPLEKDAVYLLGSGMPYSAKDIVWNCLPTVLEWRGMSMVNRFRGRGPAYNNPKRILSWYAGFCAAALTKSEVIYGEHLLVNNLMLDQRIQLTDTICIRPWHVWDWLPTQPAFDASHIPPSFATETLAILSYEAFRVPFSEPTAPCPSVPSRLEELELVLGCLNVAVGRSIKPLRWWSRARDPMFGNHLSLRPLMSVPIAPRPLPPTDWSLLPGSPEVDLVRQLSEGPSDVQRACRRFGAAEEKRNAYDRISDMASILNTVLVPPRSRGITQRLAHEGSCLIAKDPQEQEDLKRFLKDAYDVRSRLSHELQERMKQKYGSPEAFERKLREFTRRILVAHHNRVAVAP